MNWNKLFLLSFLVFFSTCSIFQKQTSSEDFSFIILQINDVYEIAPLSGGAVGGLARVATVRQQLLKENSNVLTILAGDFLSPSFIGTLKTDDGKRIAGLQMIETLNAMGLDYTTFGNHEFDIKDPEVLQERIDQSAFKWTTCNALRVKNGKQEPFTQNGQAVPKYIIHEFDTGTDEKVSVGLLGVVLPFAKKDYVSYLPVMDAFRSNFEELKTKADFTIGITHLAIDEDEALAAAVPGIPLFIGGHDHVNMRKKVGETQIAKADANAKTVYIHRITYNSSTKKVSLKSTLKAIDASIPEEASTKAVVDKWQNNVAGIMASMGYAPEKVLMKTKAPLECTESAIRSRQTNFGALTVDAFNMAVPKGDIYMVNSGAMRLDDDIEGTVTEYDVLRTFPFGGTIVKLKLKGVDLKRLLKAGLVTNRGEGGYMQVKNAVQKGEDWLVAGKAIDDSNEYIVILPEFVAGGGEANLGFLKEFKQDPIEDITINGQAVRNDIRDIVMRYMESL